MNYNERMLANQRNQGGFAPPPDMNVSVNVLLSLNYLRYDRWKLREMIILFVKSFACLRTLTSQFTITFQFFYSRLV